MGQTPAYAVVRVHADSYRLVVMQGARSRIHPTAAEAVASTKLLTPKEAKDAVAQADRSSAVRAEGTRP